MAGDRNSYGVPLFGMCDLVRIRKTGESAYIIDKIEDESMDIRLRYIVELEDKSENARGSEGVFMCREDELNLIEAYGLDWDYF